MELTYNEKTLLSYRIQAAFRNNTPRFVHLLRGHATATFHKKKHVLKSLHVSEHTAKKNVDMDPLEKN